MPAGKRRYISLNLFVSSCLLCIANLTTQSFVPHPQLHVHADFLTLIYALHSGQIFDKTGIFKYKTKLTN